MREALRAQNGVSYAHSHTMGAVVNCLGKNRLGEEEISRFDFGMVKFKMPVIHLYGNIKQVVGYPDLKFKRYL